MWVSSIGRFIPAFEEAFAEICGVDYAIACNNGTSAIHLALLGCGIGPGDEVIVPTLTYIASANAVRYCGAKPVLIDSEPRTFNLDPDRIASLITSKTRAIMAVHLYGHPADMDPIIEVAARHGVLVIEDAAEAPERPTTAGAWVALAVSQLSASLGTRLSRPGKAAWYDLRQGPCRQGSASARTGVDPNRRYWFPVIGYNYRMTNIAAAIGLAQVEQFDEHLQRRRARRGLVHPGTVGP